MDQICSASVVISTHYKSIYLHTYLYTHAQRTLKLALIIATLKTELKCNSNHYSSKGGKMLRNIVKIQFVESSNSI